MTPKEKAIELVDEMYDVDLADDYGEVTMCYKHAKQCALITVDEILNLIDGFNLELTFNYYKEVKKEILTIKNN